MFEAKRSVGRTLSGVAGKKDTRKRAISNSSRFNAAVFLEFRGLRGSGGAVEGLWVAKKGS